MNIRKHLAGFAIFSVILGSAILINHFLSIPIATIPPVPLSEDRLTEKRPVTYSVRQVSLDYNNKKSYTVVYLSHQPDQPAPEKVWVTTTYFSPDSTRAENWTTTTEFRQPFARDNGEAFVAAADWELPPYPSAPGASYFARVYVSSEYQGNLSSSHYRPESDSVQAIPVVLHWPDKKNVTAVAAKNHFR